MRRWMSLALSVSVGVSFTVHAAEPAIPPAPVGVSLIRPLEDDDTSPLPPMIASQPGGYASPSTSPAMTTPAPAAKPARPPKPPPQPWKPCFFDNDFSYKNAPHTYLFGEELKDMPLDSIVPWDIAEESRLSVGGELRYRYMNENNRLRPPFLNIGARSTYDLVRWRQYLDLKHSDWVRIYVEGIDVSINRANLPVTGIDINRWDLQNGFVDLKALDRHDRPVWLRVGRQELLFGSQRLVSPLD